MKKLKLFLPLILFGALAPFTPFLDLYFSSLFFSEGHFYDNAFFHFLFSYGERIGLGFGAFAAFFFLFTFFHSKSRKWRSVSLTMVLTLVMGAGLITNVLLKGYYGRPRPKQIAQFGGKHAFHPFWKPDFHTKNDPQKSFPSGHVAMGFYFLALAFSGKRKKNLSLFYSGLFLSFFFGGGLMVARVAQGGHFFSDVLFSALLMGYLAFFMDKCVTWAGSVWPLLADSKPNDTFLKQQPSSKALK